MNSAMPRLCLSDLRSDLADHPRHRPAAGAPRPSRGSGGNGKRGLLGGRVASACRIVSALVVLATNVDGVAASSRSLAVLPAPGTGVAGLFDAHDDAGQVRPDRGCPHLHRRAAVAVAILVFAGVHVTDD